MNEKRNHSNFALKAAEITSWKKVYAYISTISSAAEIPIIGFARGKSPLQNVVPHQTVECSHFEFLRTKCEHPHFYRRFQYYAKMTVTRATKNNHSYMEKCATLWGARIYNQNWFWSTQCWKSHDHNIWEFSKFFHFFKIFDFTAKLVTRISPWRSIRSS